MANMPPMQSFPELLKKLWQRLGSMSLAIILLMVLAIASVIGTVLLQNQNQTDYLQQFGPLWYWVFRSLGLFDMYHTWWFITLLGFLMVSLSSCLWRNVPKFTKEMRARKGTISARALARMKLQEQWPLTSDISIDSLQETFRSRLYGWEFKQTEENGVHYVRADKGRFQKVGYISVHSAMLIILIGGWMSVEFGFRGNMAVPEGAKGHTIEFLKGTDTATLDMPFEVRCNSFVIDFFPTGAPKEFRSNLTIIDDGKEVLTTDIIVNEPLLYKDVYIYQASFGDGGSDITFKLYNMDGTAETRTAKTSVYKSWTDEKTDITLKVTDFKPYNVENMANPGEPVNFKDLGPSVIYEIRGPGLKPAKIKAYMNPFFDIKGKNMGSWLQVSLTGDAADFQSVGLGLDLTNPQEWKLFHAFMSHLSTTDVTQEKTKRMRSAFKMAMQDVFGDERPENFQEMAVRTMEAMQTLPQIPWPYIPMLDDYTHVYYTGLQLAKDPGMNVVWVGSGILVIGLCIMFYMPHRKLWLVIRPENDGITVVFAGLTNRNHMAFKQTFNDLFTQFDQDFKPKI
ncbi:MAG: cytochrome c biogenesis protein ResB [Mariprofundus sp.]|nr:cytochrome c biogenesis protein ResB [Mariprofundus sp.]